SARPFARLGPTAQLFDPAYGYMNACGPGAPNGPVLIDRWKNVRARSNTSCGTCGRFAPVGDAASRGDSPTFGKPSIVATRPTGVSRLKSFEPPRRAYAAASSGSASSNVSRSFWYSSVSSSSTGVVHDSANAWKRPSTSESIGDHSRNRVGSNDTSTFKS